MIQAETKAGVGVQWQIAEIGKKRDGITRKRVTQNKDKKRYGAVCYRWRQVMETQFIRVLYNSGQIADRDT
ncbi:hypothetical protein GCM10011346_39950 [Oceanobacillus neutriphilus]|uniref:Transposase n=1 Tax=Oceanobacillus neutriphilus TaxID=531815 RepID=A0ABQ2P022_9BACI|nr:hypothetical protein GCM10011346_39950 [Oceanobacillus neutriphilus]